MTRINVVPVEELTDKHLVAEYRELPRIYKAAVKFFNRNDKSQIPDKYKLGSGHVKFFYKKLTFINKRHNMLIDEMKRRGFKPTFDGVIPDICKVLPQEFWEDYTPTEEALKINRERIERRINGIKD